MQQKIYQFRERFTYWILLLFIPVEVLTFLWQPESTVSKALLIVKFVLLGVLYFLYADRQKWYIHVMLCATCISMGISVIRHGGSGTLLLIICMLLAMITFPRIELNRNRLSKYYVFFAIGGVSVSLYGIIANYINGTSAFSWRGVFNPNTFGMLVLSIFFYFISALHMHNETGLSWIDLFALLAATYLVFRTGCRSALLCIMALLICSFLVYKTKYGQITYYLVAIASVVLCLAIGYVGYKLDPTFSANDVEILGKKLFSGREKIWMVALNGFLETPLWGQPNEYLTELTNLSSAHNVFMGILVAEGLLPSVIYVFLLFTPGKLLNYRSYIMTITINKLCFIASIVLTTFECAYTDNRLALLYLPLLLSVETEDTKVLSHSIELNWSAEGIIVWNEKEHERKKKRTTKIIVHCAMGLLVVIGMLEPLVLSIVHENLPMKADRAYLEEVGYDEDCINLLEGKGGRSYEQSGVIWEWNGKAYDVIGTAENVSFVNYYESLGYIPNWISRGEQYHVIYEAENVRFQIYYYLSGKDEPYCLVDTTTSIDFTMPKDVNGIVIRLALQANETAKERVMPILYSVKNETKRISDKRKIIPDVSNRKQWNEIGYPDNSALNLLDNKHNTSIERQQVVWEWNNACYYVEGTAPSISFVNLYASSEQLPAWVEQEKEYHVVYEAKMVRFQIYYYTPEQQICRLVDTITSTNFSIPENATGLIVRLALLEGETACESVMPIIMACEK